MTGAIRWANTLLLLWLPLIPFETRWMGEDHFVQLPTAVCGFSLLMPAIACYTLQLAIVRSEGPGSALAPALGRDIKGKASIVACLAVIALCVRAIWAALAIFAGVALLWLVPDHRIERQLEQA